MAKRKKSGYENFAIALLLLALAGVLYFGSTQLFSVGLDLQSDTVYLPVFTNTECAVIEPDYTETYDWNARQNGDGWITEFCSRNDHEVYTNRCELELQREDQGTFTSSPYITDMYVCPIGTEFSERNQECSRINGAFGTFSFDSDEFIIARARDSFGFGEVEPNEIKIKKVANWYGLKTIDSNNFLSKEVTCDVGRIQEKGFTFLNSDAQEKAPSGVLEFNQVMNYVSAVSPAVSKNVIQYEGRVVWTTGNEVAYPVETDPDGVKFVNLKDPISAPDLICNPALPYCSDDGTELINIDSSGGEDGGKTCNEIYGGFTDQYIPNPNNPNKVCKTRCGSDGVLEPYACKTIPECETGTLDENYECVTANVPQDGEGFEINSGVVLIIGVFMVLALLLIAVKLRQSKRGGR